MAQKTIAVDIDPENNRGSIKGRLRKKRLETQVVWTGTYI
jgi:hypothetical protein